MLTKTVADEKRRQVISACLNQFVEKGLYKTSTRDLSRAINLKTSGMYTYFRTKDEAVLLCAEEAALRLEENLIVPAVKELYNPEKLMKNLRTHADEMAPTMRFLAQVSSVEHYHECLGPVLNNLSNRYKKYAEEIATVLHCETKDIAPYLYICITAVSNYMIFGEESYILPQIELVKNRINELSKVNEGKK